jgi:Uma2 family endonuclease
VSSAPSHHLTAEEYLEIERKAPTKSELIHGRMYAMAGASRAHTKLVANIVRSLGNQLAGKDCDVYPQDLRLKVSETGMYTYPDLAVVCGEARFEDKNGDTLLNPAVIVEVLSDSTEAYDRGAKFLHYQRLPSLKAYVLVSQSEPRLECYTRSEHDWSYSQAHGVDSRLSLPAISCDLKLAEVYDRVQLEGSTKAP